MESRLYRGEGVLLHPPAKGAPPPLPPARAADCGVRCGALDSRAGTPRLPKTRSPAGSIPGRASASWVRRSSREAARQSALQSLDLGDAAGGTDAGDGAVLARDFRVHAAGNRLEL